MGRARDTGREKRPSGVVAASGLRSRRPSRAGCLVWCTLKWVEPEPKSAAPATGSASTARPAASALRHRARGGSCPAVRPAAPPSWPRRPAIASASAAALLPSPPTRCPSACGAGRGSDALARPRGRRRSASGWSCDCSVVAARAPLPVVDRGAVDAPGSRGSAARCRRRPSESDGWPRMPGADAQPLVVSSAGASRPSRRPREGSTFHHCCLVRTHAHGERRANPCR